MKKYRAIIISVLLLGAASIAFAQPGEVPVGARCRVCGMKVAPDSAFSAQAAVDSQTIYFCDIGDMLYYHYRKGKDMQAIYFVRDNSTLEWINARDAAFVRSTAFSTPMQWGFVAFENRGDAEKHGMPLSFEGAVKLLKSL